MTEPTQEEIFDDEQTDADAGDWQRAQDWLNDRVFKIHGPDACVSIPNMMSLALAHYANHVTAELQAKITKIEDDTTVLCASVLRYRDRIATLEAELAAQDFVPIGDEHKDGMDWPRMPAKEGE